MPAFIFRTACCSCFCVGLLAFIGPGRLLFDESCPLADDGSSTSSSQSKMRLFSLAVHRYREPPAQCVGTLTVQPSDSHCATTLSRMHLLLEQKAVRHSSLPQVSQLTISVRVPPPGSSGAAASGTIARASVHARSATRSARQV